MDVSEPTRWIRQFPASDARVLDKHNVRGHTAVAPGVGAQSYEDAAVHATP